MLFAPRIGTQQICGLVLCRRECQLCQRSTAATCMCQGQSAHCAGACRNVVVPLRCFPCLASLLPVRTLRLFSLPPDVGGCQGRCESQEPLCMHTHHSPRCSINNPAALRDA